MISIANQLFNNIERIDCHEFEKDFLFIVNGKIYQTNSFVANILSPNISKIIKKKQTTKDLNFRDENATYRKAISI